jgi:hypothetical protein
MFRKARSSGVVRFRWCEALLWTAIWKCALCRHQVDYFRVARHPSRVDAKRGDHFLQADFPGLIRTMPNWITSESPTIRRFMAWWLESKCRVRPLLRFALYAAIESCFIIPLPTSPGGVYENQSNSYSSSDSLVLEGSTVRAGHRLLRRSRAPRRNGRTSQG